MAKVKGLFKVEGTLYDVNFYMRKGVLVARRAGGGFTRKAIKSSPKMERVRESNTEFAGCVAVNKAFKKALLPMFTGYKDGTLHSRLMQLWLKIKTYDMDAARGERTVAKGLESTLGKQALEGFLFTPKRASLLPAHYKFNPATLQFEVNGFDTALIDFPAKADTLSVQLQLVRFDFETRISSSTVSAPYEVTKGFTGSNFVVPGVLPDGDTGVLLAVVRVCFYQHVNGQAYLLSGDGAFGVRVVWVG